MDEISALNKVHKKVTNIKHFTINKEECKIMNNWVKQC
jgi:hypothetical protein